MRAVSTMVPLLLYIGATDGGDGAFYDPDGHPLPCPASIRQHASTLRDTNANTSTKENLQSATTQIDYTGRQQL